MQNTRALDLREQAARTKNPDKAQRLNEEANKLIQEANEFFDKVHGREWWGGKRTRKR